MRYLVVLRAHRHTSCRRRMSPGHSMLELWQRTQAPVGILSDCRWLSRSRQAGCESIVVRQLFAAELGTANGLGLLDWRVLHAGIQTASRHLRVAVFIALRELPHTSLGSGRPRRH